MTTSIFSQVSEFGISLHKAVLQSLVGQIEKMRQNCRVGKRDGVAPGQMGLDFDDAI